jgi:hypothetical protein
MAASSSSGSSFTSSSLGRPPSYGQNHVSPLDSTWTPTPSSGASTVSALTSQSSHPNLSSTLRPLDLGPPGYQATMYDHGAPLASPYCLQSLPLCPPTCSWPPFSLPSGCSHTFHTTRSLSSDPLTLSTTCRTLFENTPHERTIYLGPWEVVGNETRRVLWQCSYHSELMEHFCTHWPSTCLPACLPAHRRAPGSFMFILQPSDTLALQCPQTPLETSFPTHCTPVTAPIQILVSLSCM